MKRLRFAIMMPVHIRHRFLPVIFKQLYRLPGEVRIYLLGDRITDEVAEQCQAMLYRECPFPLVDERQNWQKARNFHLDFVREDWGDPGPDWCSVWDDDMVLSDPTELTEELFSENDLIYGPKVFLWDTPTQTNMKLFPHTSPVFFRHDSKDRFSESLGIVQQATEKLLSRSDVRSYFLTNPVLDYGFMSQTDRDIVFDRMKRAGKLDDYTLPLVDEPAIKDIPELLKERSLELSKGFLP